MLEEEGERGTSGRRDRVRRRPRFAVRKEAREGSAERLKNFIESRGGDKALKIDPDTERIDQKRRRVYKGISRSAGGGSLIYIVRTRCLQWAVMT